MELCIIPSQWLGIGLYAIMCRFGAFDHDLNNPFDGHVSIGTFVPRAFRFDSTCIELRILAGLS